MNPPKSMKKTSLNLMVLLPFFTDSDVPNDDSITGLNIGSSKKRSALRAVLRRRGRESCLKRRRLCRKWAMDYAYPGSIPATPEGT